jgi:hypothetical protein
VTELTQQQRSDEGVTEQSVIVLSVMLEWISLLTCGTGERNCQFCLMPRPKAKPLLLMVPFLILSFGTSFKILRSTSEQSLVAASTPWNVISFGVLSITLKTLEFKCVIILQDRIYYHSIEAGIFLLWSKKIANGGQLHLVAGWNT